MVPRFSEWVVPSQPLLPQPLREVYFEGHLRSNHHLARHPPTIVQIDQGPTPHSPRLFAAGDAPIVVAVPKVTNVFHLVYRPAIAQSQGGPAEPSRHGRATHGSQWITWGHFAAQEVG